MNKLSIGDLITTLLLLSIFCLVFIFPTWLNHDVALNLHYGKLIAEGKLPYVDFIDNNPPLIMYLSVLPVIVSRVTGVVLPSTFLLLVALLVVWSVLSVRGILVRQTHMAGRYESDVLVAVWAAFSLSLWFWHHNSFGQREHLFVILYVPYLFLRYLRWHGCNFRVWRSVSLGIAAGIGACIKPHFLFIAVLPEIYWLVTSRNVTKLVKPEIIAFVTIAFVYSVHFLLLPESVQNQFFSRWVPLIWKYYNVYGSSMSYQIRHPIFLVSVAVVVISFLIRASNKSFTWTFVRPASILVIGGLFAYFVQQKGWGYHCIPALAFAALLVGVIIGQADVITFPEKPKTRQTFEFIISEKQTRTILLFCLITLVAVTATISFTRKLSDHFSNSSADLILKAILQHSRPDDSVLVISTSVIDIYPALLFSGRKQGSRYLWTFPIAFFSSKYSDPGKDYSTYWNGNRSKEPEILCLRELEEDITRFKPKLILVRNDSSCQGCVSNFNIVEFLKTIGFLQHAMADYELINEPIPKFAVFALVSGN